MRFTIEVTAFDRAEQLQVKAADVAEALREACEEANISVKVTGIEGYEPAQVEGLKSIP